MNIVRKIPYRQTETGFLHFDLYHPETDDCKLITYLGDGVHRNEIDARFLYRLLDANYAVAILSYRDFDDCRYGVRWLQTNMADAAIYTDKIAIFGVGAGGFIALQLGLRGEANAVCAMQVDFPKTGLHEDVAKRPAKFLMVQATNHHNLKHIRQLHTTLQKVKVQSQLVTVNDSKLSDTAANTVADTLLMFFRRWI